MGIKTQIKSFMAIIYAKTCCSLYCLPLLFYPTFVCEETRKKLFTTFNDSSNSTHIAYITEILINLRAL